MPENIAKALQDDIGEDVPVKPPIGVTPRYIKDEERISEICSAIHHYIDHKNAPDREWYEELHEILSRHLNHLHQQDREIRARDGMVVDAKIV
jgi:hypothetical protein